MTSIVLEASWEQNNAHCSGHRCCRWTYSPQNIFTSYYFTAGTADTMETLTNVNLSVEQMKNVVNQEADVLSGVVLYSLAQLMIL